MKVTFGMSNTTVSINTRPYHRLGRLARALAHPTRLRIIDTLAQGEACVCHLTALLKQRQANISQHLMVLREANLVRDRRDGLMVYYRLTDGAAGEAVEALRALLQGLEPDVEFPAVAAEPVVGCPCPRCGGDGGCDEAP